MGRLGLGCFAALLVGCFPAHAPVAHEPALHFDSAADLETKTVALVEDERAYCSGVWVSQDKILTANHCVDEVPLGAPVWYVVRGDLTLGLDEVKLTHKGALRKRDVLHDLALISAPVSPPHGVATIGVDPYVGQSVQTMGAPLGLWYSYSIGVVSSVRKLDIDDVPMWYVQSTAPISPGSSGGGLFDESGRLLGVCHAYFPRGELLNLYVHAQYVRLFLA